MPVDFKDYYRVLGVERSADDAAIKRAFRDKARKLHPDVNRTDPHAEDRFKELNEAYEVLSDSGKRAKYDRFGADWNRYRDAGVDPSRSANTGTGTKPNSRAQQDDFETWFTGTASQKGDSWEYSESSSGSGGRFSDFFNMLFGNQSSGSRSSSSSQRTRRPMPRRGEDSEVAVDISLREASAGTTRNIQLQMPVACTLCGGTGLARGAMCPRCDGTGLMLSQRTLEVSIPKGVRTGSRVRIAGQGAPGVAGGPNGDVYLVIEVTVDPTFERQGNHLRQKLTIPFYTAVLGGEVVVPTLDGRVAMTVPEGTQDGRVFRLRGKGMPSLAPKSEVAGDILVEVHVAVPDDLTAEERALFIELRNLRQ